MILQPPLLFAFMKLNIYAKAFYYLFLRDGILEV